MPKVMQVNTTVDRDGIVHSRFHLFIKRRLVRNPHEHNIIE